MGHSVFGAPQVPPAEMIKNPLKSMVCSVALFVQLRPVAAEKGVARGDRNDSSRKHRDFFGVAGDGSFCCLRSVESSIPLDG
jgi:hypothetical protein